MSTHFWKFIQRSPEISDSRTNRRSLLFEMEHWGWASQSNNATCGRTSPFLILFFLRCVVTIFAHRSENTPLRNDTKTKIKLKFSYKYAKASYSSIPVVLPINLLSLIESGEGKGISLVTIMAGYFHPVRAQSTIARELPNFCYERDTWSASLLFDFR